MSRGAVPEIGASERRNLMNRIAGDARGNHIPDHHVGFVTEPPAVLFADPPASPIAFLVVSAGGSQSRCDRTSSDRIASLRPVAPVHSDHDNCSDLLELNTAPFQIAIKMRIASHSI